eukprot:964427-Rhodomonas_salina.2
MCIRDRTPPSESPTILHCASPTSLSLRLLASPTSTVEPPFTKGFIRGWERKERGSLEVAYTMR